MNINVANAAAITHWRSKAAGVAHAAVHSISSASAADGHRPHQDHPSFHRFLEQSCLAREMRHP